MANFYYPHHATGQMMGDSTPAWGASSSTMSEEDMIEPLYDDDISSIIEEVRPEDVQHFENEKFIREQMPELLKFIDESDDYQFDDWAIIGETRAEEDSPIPGSSEDPSQHGSKKPQQAANTSSPSTATAPKDLFENVDGLETRDEAAEAPEGEEEEEEEADVDQQPNETENSMVFSMFLSNWEDQVRQIREAKRLEWENKMKELLSNEGGQLADYDEEEEAEEDHEEQEAEDVPKVADAPAPRLVEDGGLEDEDGESWVMIEAEKKPDAQVNQLQVALVNDKASQVVTRPGFFENWPSFGVGSKLGVVLTATGTSFCFGFLMGARAAIDSFYRLCERPFVAGVVGVTAAYAVSIQPQVLMTAVKYIILGGVVGGTAVATPVFVVGTTGVFVSAAVYHAFIAAKRGVVRAVSSPSARPKPRALPAPDAKPIMVPLKTDISSCHHNKKHQ